MILATYWPIRCIVALIWVSCIVSESRGGGRGGISPSESFLRKLHNEKLNFRAGYSNPEQIEMQPSPFKLGYSAFRRHPTKVSCPDIYRSLKRRTNDITSSSWLQRKRFKLLLASLGGFCAIFDLMEELILRVPRVHSLLKPILQPKLSILLLCLIQISELLHEFMEKMNENNEIRNHAELDEQVGVILQQHFVSEEQAAQAHDRAAIAIFAQDAVLNFNYANTDLDEHGRPPERLSKYRGVKWSNKLHAWQVDGAYLGYQ